MATKINGANQIQAGTITRALHNTTTSGSALISKVIAGTNITLSSTGVDAGTGDVTINATATSSRTTKADVNYSATNSDQIIAYTSLTATRTVTLPAASSFPASRLLIIDESGNASSTVYINIVPNSGTDFINGTASVAITAPYGYIELESNGSHNWTISDKWTLGMAQQNPASVAITGGTIDGVAIGATNPAILNANSLNGGSLTGFKNRIINGDGRIDQRNFYSSVTPTTSSYVIDKWALYLTQASKLTITSVQTAVLPNVGPGNSGSNLYSAINCASSSTAYTPSASDGFILYQTLEGYNVADLRIGTSNASPFTVSFYVYATVTGTYACRLTLGPSTAYSYVKTYSITAANTWTYVSFTVPALTSGPVGQSVTNGGGLQIGFDLGSGTNSQAPTANAWVSGNYSTYAGCVKLTTTANSQFIVTGVQIEKGNVATAFETRPNAIELQLCKRYYQKWSAGTSGTRTDVTTGLAYSTSNVIYPIILPVSMRSTPSLSSAYIYVTNGSGTPIAASSASIQFVGVDNGASVSTVEIVVGASGLTAGQSSVLLAGAGTSGTTGAFIALDADL